MFYTSYFAKIRKFPSNVIPIAISATVPKWYDGARCTELAPNYDMLMKWKDDHKDDDYIECFNNTILSNLEADRVVYKLHTLLPREVRALLACGIWDNPDWHIALVCYEKPSDFCHRHLVAKWLRENGYNCMEWED